MGCVGSWKREERGEEEKKARLYMTGSLQPSIARCILRSSFFAASKDLSIPTIRETRRPEWLSHRQGSLFNDASLSTFLIIYLLAHLTPTLRLPQVSWAQLLAQHSHQIHSMDDWEAVRDRTITPALDHSLNRLFNDPDTKEWSALYRLQMKELLDAMTVTFTAQRTQQSLVLHRAFDRHLPSVPASAFVSSSAPGMTAAGSDSGAGPGTCNLAVRAVELGLSRGCDIVLTEDWPRLPTLTKGTHLSASAESDGTNGSESSGGGRSSSISDDGMKESRATNEDRNVRSSRGVVGAGRHYKDLSPEHLYPVDDVHALAAASNGILREIGMERSPGSSGGGS